MDDQLLTAHQAEITRRVLAEEGAKRTHVVVSLSGAHAYGFPSPDSDLDLKAVHAEKPARLLGLRPPDPHSSRMEILEGVEVDYSSNELGPVLSALLAGNGNYFERFLGDQTVIAGPGFEELRVLAQGALSKKVHRHYSGFARGQLREWEKSGFKSAKKLLYVLRTTLTGTHLLLTGEMQTDVTKLMDVYGFALARELVESKKRGEKSELAPEVSERWKLWLDAAFQGLDQAMLRSPLPEESPNADALDDWLVRFRLRDR
ncbi:MAG TPA: nucleotidyltransferase domain-containing protein [Myxococcales bacterium]